MANLVSLKGFAKQAGERARSNLALAKDNGIDKLRENIENCVNVSIAYKEKHNELIEVYINYLSSLKENQQMSDNAAKNQQTSEKIAKMLKELQNSFGQILSKGELVKLQEVQQKMKSNWIQTTGAKNPQPATNIIEEINQQFPSAQVAPSDTYQIVINKLKALTDTSASQSAIMGGGKRNKKSFRKLKKYKKVFKRKSKKMRR